jgi:3-dehydroquinate synthetase
MLLETKIAIKQGICEKAYGEKLIEMIQCALSVLPVSAPKLDKIEEYAMKASADKKNAEDQKIVLSVAKVKNEWALLSLSRAEYISSLQSAIAKIESAWE